MIQYIIATSLAHTHGDPAISTEMISAVFSGLALLLTIWVQYRLTLMGKNVEKIQVHTNSMQTAMIASAKKEGKAEGEAEGKSDRKAEHKS